MPEQTIHSRSGFSTKPIHAERRVQMRYACTGDIALQPLMNRKAGVWRPAQVENISTKGIGLLLDAAIERGTILSVKLEGPAQRFSRPLLVRVIRVTERPGGGWQTGCTFAIPLDEEELGALLRADNASQASVEKKQPAQRAEKKLPEVPRDPFIDGSAVERRCVHRRHLSAAVVLSYGSGFEETLEALAIDGSIGGLKLLSGKPFGRGTIIRVRILTSSQRVPAVEMCVKSCRPQQTMWMIGAQFVQPPSSDVMLSLS
jgi:hypothetical protein